MLSGVPHIQEAFLEHQIKSKESKFPDVIINTKIVPANALIFIVFKKACVSDSFIMIKIWGDGVFWVNELIKLLVLDDLNHRYDKQNR